MNLNYRSCRTSIPRKRRGKHTHTHTLAHVFVSALIRHTNYIRLFIALSYSPFIENDKALCVGPMTRTLLGGVNALLFLFALYVFAW